MSSETAIDLILLYVPEFRSAFNANLSPRYGAIEYRVAGDFADFVRYLTELDSAPARSEWTGDLRDDESLLIRCMLVLERWAIDPDSGTRDLLGAGFLEMFSEPELEVLAPHVLDVTWQSLQQFYPKHFGDRTRPAPPY